MVFLKMFFELLTCVSSFFSIFIIFRFDNFSVDFFDDLYQECFYIYHFLCLSYPFFPTMSSMPEVLFSTSDRLLVKLTSEVTVLGPQFFISKFLSVWVFLLILFQLSCLEMFYSFFHCLYFHRSSEEIYFIPF